MPPSLPSNIRRLFPHDPELRALAVKGQSLERQLEDLAFAPITLTEVEQYMAVTDGVAYGRYMVSYAQQGVYFYLLLGATGSLDQELLKKLLGCLKTSASCSTLFEGEGALGPGAVHCTVELPLNRSAS